MYLVRLKFYLRNFIQDTIYRLHYSDHFSNLRQNMKKFKI